MRGYDQSESFLFSKASLANFEIATGKIGQSKFLSVIFKESQFITTTKMIRCYSI